MKIQLLLQSAIIYITFNLGNYPSGATPYLVPFHAARESDNKMIARSDFPWVTDFFPGVQNDLTRIKWAHGVDSAKKLNQALRGDIMMTEADVSLGTVTKDKVGYIQPIMAHPPIKSSDLSLGEFLDTILDYHTPKGIKLDIKDNNVFEQTLNIIKHRESKIVVPFWINADILQGPVNAVKPTVDAIPFLTMVKTNFPRALISVGWTTRYGPDLSHSPGVIKEGFYSFEHVSAMCDVLKIAEIQQPITFPLRAGLSTSIESRKNILWLLNQVPGSSITIWGGFYDSVDVDGLMELISSVGKERIYIDVPSDLKCQISRYNSMSKSSTWLFGSPLIGRKSRFSIAASVLAFLVYMTCGTFYLPWNAGSYVTA